MSKQYFFKCFYFQIAHFGTYTTINYFSHGRGRGRGHRGSRGGRSFSDDVRDVQDGGRSGYAGRSYYSDNRGGYHGGRGGRGTGRGAYGPQERGYGQSHGSETHTERNPDGSRVSNAQGGAHGNNDRRDQNQGGNLSGNANPADSTNHGAVERTNVGVTASSASGGHGHTMKFAPAPEFEMKGNDFPALPGAGESIPRKASESSEGANAWGETNR